MYSVIWRFKHFFYQVLFCFLTFFIHYVCFVVTEKLIVSGDEKRKWHISRLFKHEMPTKYIIKHNWYEQCWYQYSFQKLLLPLLYSKISFPLIKLLSTIFTMRCAIRLTQSCQKLESFRRSLLRIVLTKTVSSSPRAWYITAWYLMLSRRDELTG